MFLTGDEGDPRIIRTLGCWCDVNAAFTFLPTATTGFSDTEEDGRGCCDGDDRSILAERCRTVWRESASR
jgi:hypothetical protein